MTTSEAWRQSGQLEVLCDLDVPIVVLDKDCKPTGEVATILQCRNCKRCTISGLCGCPDPAPEMRRGER